MGARARDAAGLIALSACAARHGGDRGISSSFWTAVTAIPSVLFGIDWFHADFELWPVVLGIGGHMMNSMMIGVVGDDAAGRRAGRRPPLIAAVMQGVIRAAQPRQPPPAAPAIESSGAATPARTYTWLDVRV